VPGTNDDGGSPKEAAVASLGLLANTARVARAGAYWTNSLDGMVMYSLAFTNAPFSNFTIWPPEGFFV
jgi:hypothetical protein